MKYIYCFTYYSNESPSVRYRSTYLLTAIEKQYAIPHSIVYPGYSPKTILHFIGCYFSAIFFRKADSVIIIQRIYSKGLYARLLRLLIRLRPNQSYYDLDDAEYLEQPTESINFFLRHCTAAIVGSEALKLYTNRFAKQSILITSAVTRHGIRKQKKNDVFTIGWIGCFWGAHRNSLYQLFFPALLTAKVKTRLVIIGAKDESAKVELRNYFADNSLIEINFQDIVDWMDEALIYESIATFDIGVSPLLDTEINRCKSAYKLKQYLSCGVPALASPIGENVNFIEEGKNGFFCERLEDFENKIEFFRNLSEEGYQKFSIAALQSTTAFEMEKIAEEWVHQLSSSSDLPL